MSNSTIGMKRCNGCQKDVTGQQRMKDASGRYWCVSCGTSQQKKKALMAAESRSQAKGKSGAGARTGLLVKLLVVMGLLAAGAAWQFSAM